MGDPVINNLLNIVCTLGGNPWDVILLASGPLTVLGKRE